jgi:hemoglobin-like flavoprotein
MSLPLELLEESFEKIKPIAPQFADTFYENLFSDYPESQALFAHTNMAQQKQHLVKALALIVANLRDPDALTANLKALGSRHLTYGAITEHYPLVGSTLLKTMSFYLANEWTPEVKQAWIDAYDAIASIMLEGADSAESPHPTH